MPKKLDYTLDDEQAKTIEDALNHEKRAEVVRRATAIRLLHLGHTAPDVAHMMAVSLATVYLWHHRWVEKGLEGLANQPKSGRPSTADARSVASESLQAS